MIRTCLSMAILLACSGCASVFHAPVQDMRIEARTQAGAMVPGADCQLSNDHGSLTMKAGQTAAVPRSAKDLEIVCTDARLQGADFYAQARVVSRANASMWGNLLVGGGIGAIVDHSRGTAYSYPTWIRLVFGKTLVFDRGDEKEGEPTLGSAAADTVGVRNVTSKPPGSAAQK